MNILNHPIYFDQAATSFPKPPEVSQAMMYYMNHVGSNVNRGSYGTAVSAENVLFDTRQKLTDLFHGEDCKNTIFTANITTSLNILLKGLLKPGNHVLTTSLEHNAVMRPLHQLTQNGVTFDRIPCDGEGNLLTEAMPSLLHPNTVAVIATHASNVCGTMTPLEEIGNFCLKHNLYFLVDSAQTAGSFPIDMQKMHIDALAFTGHKGLLGPQGTGGFLLRERMVSLITPLLSGGTGSLSYSEDIPSFMPDRFEPGTPNLPGIYGLQAALGFLEATGPDTVRKQEAELTGRFLEGLSVIPRIRIFGRKDLTSRAPVVSIQIEEMDPASAADRLEREFRIQTRVGLHCAPSAHKALGTFPSGTIRFSFGYFNTDEEIDICLEALKEVCNGIQTT